MNALLDLILNIVTGVVIIVVAIPALALLTSLFYAVPLYVFIPAVAAIVALATYGCRFAARYWPPS
jgi:hypothetical protein